MAQIQTSSGLTIGSAAASGSITVTGLTKANTDDVTTATVTLLATVDDSSITFATAPSTFLTLAAQADNAVSLQVAVTTTTSTMYLDGDVEDDA